MSVAEWSGSLLDWEQALAGLKARLSSVFGRAELRCTASSFLDGLLSGVARKTGWLLAEQAGLSRPYRMQSLLGRSHWEADGLRDAVRDYVIEALGDGEGVLVVDDTGFVKKGRHSASLGRLVLRANIPARPVGSRTVRSVSFWPMRADTVRRLSIDGFICRKIGPKIRPDAPRRRCRMR